MLNCCSKHAVLTAALSVAAIMAATPGMARPWGWSSYIEPSPYYRAKPFATKKKNSRNADKPRAADRIPIPSGPLQIVVSIKSQRVTLYANGTEVIHAPVSTGTPSHPTPMGLFTVIQKDRHHVSNLYDAAMPYMQRITWSGSALHQGPLPGYPASHGCIRLPTDFAIMLWQATKLGARVVIARDDVKPFEIEHPLLFERKLKLDATLRPRLPIRTADNANPRLPTVVADNVPTREAPKTDALMVAPPAAPVDAKRSGEKSAVIEPVASARDIKRRASPVSVFISRKDNRLYVRQAMQPLFDLPITIRNANEPIGTHVFTAIEIKSTETAMRWNAISIPSSYPRAPRAPHNAKARKSVEPIEPVVETPVPSAKDALDRLELTQDIRDQIGALLLPGSSLIISDNSLASGETGSYTDFIVLTR